MGPTIHHFAQAAREIDSGTVDPGLWTLATGQACGDTTQAAAIYLRLRAEGLAREDLQKCLEFSWKQE